jgi:hypothetical protein
MGASKRRRHQMVNNHDHLSPRQRPNYRMRSAEASAARLREAIATERRMQQGKKK